MIRRVYKGSGRQELIFEEFIPNEFHQMKTVRLYARDLLAEINLIAMMALLIFGVIFAVPMVRHELTYILYWTGTFIFSIRTIWKRFYSKPKKKRSSASRNR